jgi:hypothetical protein
MRSAKARYLALDRDEVLERAYHASTPNVAAASIT